MESSESGTLVKAEPIDVVLLAAGTLRGETRITALLSRSTTELLSQADLGLPAAGSVAIQRNSENISSL